MFVGSRSRPGQDARGKLAEGVFVPGLADGEPAHQRAPDAIRSFGVFVFPGLGVPGAGRQHVYVVTAADLFGQYAAGVVWTRGDIGPVPCRDERELHLIS